MERPICPKVQSCRYQMPSPEHMGERCCSRRWADGHGPGDCAAPFVPVRLGGED